MVLDDLTQNACALCFRNSIGGVVRHSGFFCKVLPFQNCVLNLLQYFLAATAFHRCVLRTSLEVLQIEIIALAVERYLMGTRPIPARIVARLQRFGTTLHDTLAKGPENQVK